LLSFADTRLENKEKQAKTSMKRPIFFIFSFSLS
jgi:hypothetical protein